MTKYKSYGQDHILWSFSDQKYEAVVYFVFTDFVQAEAEKKTALVTLCLPQIIVTPWLLTTLVLKFEYPFLPFVSKNLLHKLQTE